MEQKPHFGIFITGITIWRCHSVMRKNLTIKTASVTDDHLLSNCAELHTENLVGLYRGQYEEFWPAPLGS